MSPIPNVIRFSGTTTQGILKKGNYYLGVNDDVDYGPTTSTNFWNGITPPTNGYTIYLNKESQGPSIVCPPDVTNLIYWAKVLGGTNINTENDALNYLDTRNDVVCVNSDYPNIITSGLCLLLDSGFIPSYKKSGSTWTDLSLSGKNATLINSPSFSGVNQGLLLFSASSSQYATTSDLGTLSNFTVNCWYYMNTIPQLNKYPALVCNTYDLVSKLNFSLGVNESPWSGKISGGFYNAGWYNTAGFTPTANTWTNACVTYDGSYIKLYRDGSLFSSAATSTAAVTSGQGVRIARRWDDVDYIDGYIPIVNIYNRALSASEISQNYSVINTRFLSVTPTPTPSITPTKTITPTVTQTPTFTPTQTQTITPSITPSTTITPSLTPTITTTPSITPSSSIGVTFSRTFTANTSPGTTIETAWTTFRSQLTGSYTKFDFTSSNGSGYSGITDSVKVQQIANALRTGTTGVSFSTVISGVTWNVGCCACRSGGAANGAVEFANVALCSGSSTAALRPWIANLNWGGIGSTVGAATQTLTLKFY